MRGAWTTGKRRFLIGATTVVGAIGTVAAAVAVRDELVAERAREGRRGARRSGHQQARAGPEDQRRMARQGRAGSSTGRRRCWRACPSSMTRLLIRSPMSIISRRTPRTRIALRKPEIFVAVGICTHLGLLADLPTGHRAGGSRARLAGRLFLPLPSVQIRSRAGAYYKGVPAPTNLIIPPYQIRVRHRRS